MKEIDYVDFQLRTEPLAYLITFRCYGSWLHGNEHGAMDRRRYNVYGTPAMPANIKLLENEKADLKTSPITLNRSQRVVVEQSIREACAHRGYDLLGINVRTNHIHSVVRASCTVERAMNTLKAYATRSLRKAGLLRHHVKPWARHGSTRYLWTDKQVSNAIAYTLYDQGTDLFQ